MSKGLALDDTIGRADLALKDIVSDSREKLYPLFDINDFAKQTGRT